ncbi:MAG: FeoA family protein [Bacillota bacterium]
MSTTGYSLQKLPLGQTATIVAILTEGLMRRRLLDLGFIPGTRITAILQSPLKDPVAYLVKGALIALRKEETEQIIVQ